MDRPTQWTCNPLDAASNRSSLVFRGLAVSLSIISEDATANCVFCAVLQDCVLTARAVLGVGTKDDTVSSVVDDAKTTAAKLVIADWYFMLVFVVIAAAAAVVSSELWMSKSNSMSLSVSFSVWSGLDWSGVE